MKKRRILCFLLCLALLLPCVLPARAAGYTFLDYTRIYGSKDRKSYTVECSFGAMTVPGKLTYTGEYSIEQINHAAEIILGRMGITEQDMNNALLIVSEWEKAQEFTAEDAWEIGENISKILGGDDYVTLAKSMWDYFSGTANNETTLLSLLNQLKDQQFKAVEDAVKDWVLDQVLDLSGDGLQIAGFSMSQQVILEILINTVVVSLEQWQKDQERWKDREAAVNANALIRDFYDRLNLYLMDETPSGANWVLTAAGQQTRYFKWFGSTGNAQYITMALAAHKSNQYAGLYAYRGQGANMPFGTYTGSAAIRLTHNLASFDSQFWNLPIGIFKKNWLNDLIYVSSLAGGAELKTESKTEIIRELKGADIQFTIPGGYSYQYNSTIPATPGNRDVYASIPISAFQDNLTIHETHTLSYHQGLGLVNDAGQLGGLEAVSMELTGHVGANNVSITGDDLQAYCNLAGIEFADVSQSGVSGGSSTDNNIWADMGQGIRLKILLR